MHINFSFPFRFSSIDTFLLPSASVWSVAHEGTQARLQTVQRSLSTVYEGVFSPRTYAIRSASEEDWILTRSELSNVRVEFLCGAQSVTVEILCDQKMQINNCLLKRTRRTTMETGRLAISRAFVCCSNIIFLVSHQLFISRI